MFSVGAQPAMSLAAGASRMLCPINIESVPLRAMTDIVQPIADPKQPLVAAHWKPVNLKLDDFDTVSSSGNCELLDQIRTKILPLFATRDLDYQSNCIPHQASITGGSLKVTVPFADPKEEKGVAAIQSGSSPVKP